MGTLFVTAAVTVGAVEAVKRLKRRAERRRKVRDRERCAEPAIDLEADADSGVWRLADEPT